MNADVPTVPASRGRSRGQILVIFAGAAIMLMALSAVVIDVSWYWSSNVKMQRAADAASLAGVVRLPGDVPGAQTLARNEASRNGYTSGVAGITVTPLQDAQSTRRLIVTIAGPVNTFFARIVGLNSFPATVTSKAQYVLPVPMGSPENYYGVFGETRGLTETTTTTTIVNVPSDTNSGQDIASTSPATASPGVGWTASNGTTEALRVTAVSANNSSPHTPYLRTNTNGAFQVFGGFGLTSQLTNQTVTQIHGIEVFLDDAFLSANCSGSRIRVQLSWNGGVQWTVPPDDNQTGTLSTGTNDYSFGDNSDTNDWDFNSPNHTWQPADIEDANFRVRLTAVKGCATAGTEIRLDQLRVRAYYRITTPTPQTTTDTDPVPDVNLKGPGTACGMGVANCFTVTNGQTLNPRGFWGTMNTQGAANVNGDAHQPEYDTVGGTGAPDCAVAPAGSACYDPDEYYNYAIEMPQGATNGSVYIYDPSFCAVDTENGTGDRWFDNNDIDPITSTYEVWDTNNTLYDRSDDGPSGDGSVPNATSGNLFSGMEWSDTTMGGTTSGSPAQCRTNTDSAYGDGRDYHNRWYRLYTGMTGGVSGPRIYRVHTTSTTPSAPTQQRVANGMNSFAIYASATGGTPRVYGLGAMQAFTPLEDNGGSAEISEFFLAQIDQVHATKTVEISLWDPGDTTPLSASIEILIPTSGGWTATPVTYSATLGTTNSGRADGAGSKPDCRLLSRTTASTTPISTYTSGGSSTTGKFNGCWMTIRAVIPAGYQAHQDAWWKIRYAMSGNGVSNDVTTWKVQILGNPVHLVVN